MADQSAISPFLGGMYALLRMRIISYVTSDIISYVTVHIISYVTVHIISYELLRMRHASHKN